MINALVWVLVIIFAGICRPDALKELLPVLAAGAAFSIIFNGKLGRSCK